MRPGKVLGEAREETGRRDAAAIGTADIGEVGEIRFELLLVFVPQGHAPDAVPGFLAGLHQGHRQVLMVAPEPAGMAAQSHHAGAGQGRHVNHGGGFIALRVMQRIAEQQPALGIGVQYLYGQAGHALDDVPRLVRRAGRQIFRCGNQGDHVQRQLEFRHRGHGADHAGPAAHVVFHLVHIGRGFDRDATSIKRETLAHQDIGFGLGGRPGVLHDDEAGGFLAAAGDGEKSPHAQLLDGLFVEDLDLEFLVFLADLFSLIGEVSRGADIPRQVGEVSGQTDPHGNRMSLPDRVFSGRESRIVMNEKLDLVQSGFVVGVLGLQFGEAISRCLENLYELANVPGRVTSGHFSFMQGADRLLGMACRQRLGGGRERLPIGAGIELLLFAHAHQDHSLDILQRGIGHHQQFARLTLDVIPLEELFQQPPHAFVQRGR